MDSKLLYAFGYLIEKDNNKHLKLSIKSEDKLIDSGLIIGIGNTELSNECFFIENKKVKNFKIKFMQDEIKYEDTTSNYDDIDLMKINDDIFLTLNEFPIYNFPSSFNLLMKKQNLHVNLFEDKFRLTLEGETLFAYNVNKEIFYEFDLLDNVFIKGKNLMESSIYESTHNKKFLMTKISLIFDETCIVINCKYNNLMLLLGFANLN